MKKTRLIIQVDNTFNRLQTLCEYIDDTEDYINIELDNHRNQLIRLELMLTAATFAVSLVGVSEFCFSFPPSLSFSLPLSQTKKYDDFYNTLTKPITRPSPGSSG